MASTTSFTSSTSPHLTPSKSVISHYAPSRVLFRNLHVSAASTPGATSLYDVLGIQEGATCQDIKAAYRRLARVLHPDVINKELPKDASSSSWEFIKLNEAYKTLSDPDKRAHYDRCILWRRRSSMVRGSAVSGYRIGRRWETDQCW